jgi:hypothetical protein
MGPTALLPLRRKACWGFFRPKNPTASAGCETANLGTKGQHATSRLPTWQLTIVTHWYYNIMGPPSYMRPVVDRNVVMRRMTVTIPTSWEIHRFDTVPINHAAYPYSGANSVRNQERFSPECPTFYDRNSASNFQFPLFRCMPRASPISSYLAEARILRTSPLLNYIHHPLIPARVQTFSPLFSQDTMRPAFAARA